jgi:hypothetical protein
MSKAPPKGGDALCVREVISSRLRPGASDDGGKVMRRTARLLFCASLIVGGVIGPVHAREQGGLLSALLGAEPKASPVQNACLDQQVAINYAAYMMGYHVFGPGGERISAEKDNALAQEIISRATITDWSFKGHDGGSSYGHCHMHFSMTLASAHAARFNNIAVWDSDVSVGISNETGQWNVLSFDDGGARSTAYGWLAVWRAERDRQPGGAPQLASAPSRRELQMKIDAARSCGSSWEVSDHLFPAYNAWLDTLAKPSLLKFKVGNGARLDAGRLVAADDQATVCRYNISTGDFSGRIERSIRDLDFRFTVAGGRPQWEVASFPYAPASSFTSAQISELMSHIYVDDKQLKPSTEAERGQGTEAQAYDWDAIVREANR